MRLPTENFKSPSAFSRFLLVCILGVGLDLWTKHYSFQHLTRADAPPWDGRPRSVEFVKGWVHFEITTNHGAVFGLGQGRKAFFLTISVLAIFFLSYLFATSAKKQWFYQVVLGMLLAGVLGNMYDRIVYGYVRDMIHALPGWTWPGKWQLGWSERSYPGPGREVFPFIFNVADILLCVGVGLMIAYSAVVPDPKKSEAAERARDE